MTDDLFRYRIEFKTLVRFVNIKYGSCETERIILDYLTKGDWINFKKRLPYKQLEQYQLLLGVERMKRYLSSKEVYLLDKKESETLLDKKRV